MNGHTVRRAGRRALCAALLAGMLLGLGVGAQTALADAREQHPLQLQVDGVGFSLGYHFSPLVYLGVTRQSGYGPIDTVYRGPFSDKDKQELYGQNGVDSSKETDGGASAVELRFSPWSFGLYFAVGYVDIAESTQEIEYESRARVIGDTAYNDTDLSATITKKQQSGGAVGLGYNHVFESGWSLGLGLLGVVNAKDPDVELSSSNEDVSNSDLNKLKNDMISENRGATLGHFALGFNF